MEKDDVIKVRNKLKAGKNWPLIVYLDNTFKLINESNTLQFVKWDDENGILYNYSLTNPILEKSPSNIGGSISLFAVAYEHIQAMEVARLNISHLKESLDSLECITDEWKQRIIKRFEMALNPDLVNFSTSDINEAMGVIDGQKALNDKDDYYNNRFTQSFAETRAKAEYNASLDKTNDTKTTVEETESAEVIESEVENTESSTEEE